MLREVVPQWRILCPVAIPNAQGILRTNIMPAAVSKAFSAEVVAGRVPGVIRPVGQNGEYRTMIFRVV
jgi:hypothetical protein